MLHESIAFGLDECESILPESQSKSRYGRMGKSSNGLENRAPSGTGEQGFKNGIGQDCQKGERLQFSHGEADGKHVRLMLRNSETRLFLCVSPLFSPIIRVGFQN